MGRSGVYAVIDKLTSQGYDMQFGTNVLGMGRYRNQKHRVLRRGSLCRAFLFHQIAPSTSHGDCKELSQGIGARRQRQLHRPLCGATRWYTVGHA